MASRRIRRTKSLAGYTAAVYQDLIDLKSRGNYRSIAASAISGDGLAEEIELINKSIQSSNYTPGVDGWKIDGSGNAEFGNVYVRGDINAYSGTIGYWNISNPSVERTFGDTKLFGTFLESFDHGFTDEGATIGSYVSLFKSYVDIPIAITKISVTSDVVTLTVPDHNFIVGDKIIIEFDDAIYSEYESNTYLTVTETTPDTFSYIKLVADGESSNIVAEVEASGVAQIYNKDIAGLYLRDYSKQEFDYGYFSNTGVAYVSAEDINVIENPSFEYDNAYSANSWTAGAGLTLTAYGVDLSSSSIYKGSSLLGLGVNWTTTTDAYLTGTIDYAAGNAYGIFGLGKNLYFGITVFPNYTPASATITSIETYNLSETFTSANATTTTITYTGTNLDFSAGQYITVPQPGNVGFSNSRFNITNQKVKTANSTTVTVELAGGVVSTETTTVVASTGLLKVVVPATSPFVSGDTAFLDVDAGVFDPSYGEIIRYYSPHTIADGSQGHTYTVAPFPVPTTTTFYLQTEYGFTETAATALTLESHFNSDGVTDRLQKIYNAYELALDLSAITFTYSTGEVSTSISDVISTGTSALWSSDSKNKYLLSTANDYMLGYLDTTVKIPAMTKSISIILDGASMGTAYLAADATGYASGADIEINLPGWLSIHDGNGVLPPSPFEPENIGYVLDNVYLSTASNFFYGSGLANYRWYTPTEDTVITGPSQASIEGTKSWIDVNLESQSAYLDYFDYVGFRNNTFEYDMTDRPGITVLDTTNTIVKFPDSTYETTTVTGGKYQYSASATEYVNIASSLRLLTGDRSSAFELSALSKNVSASGRESAPTGAIIYGVYDQNDSGASTIYTGSDTFVWTSYPSALDNTELASVIFTSDLATFRQNVLGLAGFTGSTLRLTTTTTMSLASTAHALQIGPSTAVNLRLDSNEMQAVNNGAASTLYLNRLGGNVSIGNAASTITIAGTLNVTGTTIYENEASFTGTTTYQKLRITSQDGVGTGTQGFQLGATAGLNLQMDRNSIQTYNNGVAAAIDINGSGGSVSIGASASPVIIENGNLLIKNSADVPGAVSTVGGGTLFVEDGALKYRGTSGSNATIIYADGSIAGSLGFVGSFQTTATSSDAAVTLAPGSVTTSFASNISIIGGATTNTTGTAGEVYITGGAATTGISTAVGGNVVIRGGATNSTAGAGGDVTINGGLGSGANGNGSISIGALTTDGVTIGAPLRLSPFTVAGYVTNDASGNIGTVTTIPQSAITDLVTNLGNKADEANPTLTGTATGLEGLTGSASVNFTLTTPSSTSGAVTKSVSIGTGSGVYFGSGTGASGSITIDTGAGDNAAAGVINIGTTNTPTITIGRTGSTTSLLGTVSGLTKSTVGLANVDNTSDANKPVSTAQASAIALKANVDSAVFTGNLPSVTSSTATSVKKDTDLTNRAYVDSQIVNLTWRLSVVCATTGALGTSNNLVGGTITTTYANGTAGVGATLTIATSASWSSITIDEQSINVGDRILIKNQTAALQNGIYTVTTKGTLGTTTSFVFTRATDADGAAENFSRYGVYVENGSVSSDYADKAFTNIVDGDVVMGTTSLTFTLAAGLSNAIIPVSGFGRIPYTNSNRGISYTIPYSDEGQILKSGFAAPGADIGWYDPTPYEVKTGKITSTNWDDVASPVGEVIVTFDVPFQTGAVPHITFTPISTSTTSIFTVTLKAAPTNTGFTAIIRTWNGTAFSVTTEPTVYWTAIQGAKIIGTPDANNDGRTDYGAVG